MQDTGLKNTDVRTKKDVIVSGEDNEMSETEKTINVVKGFKTVREGGKEYLVAHLGYDDTFTGKMIVKNKIPSILEVTSREFNGETYIYYDVSGRVRFCDMFSGEKDIMEREDVERLCKSLKNLTVDVRDYLLDIEEVFVSTQTCFFNPEKKSYEFLYIPDRKEYLVRAGENCEDKSDDGGETAAVFAKGSFAEGVKAVWDRVMEKFNHHSDIESIARVYDIYQKVSMHSFDPEEVFAPSKVNSAETDILKSENVSESGFSKEQLKEKIAGSTVSEQERMAEYAYFGNALADTDAAKSDSKCKSGVFEGLKMKLAGSAGLFSGVKTGKDDKKIEEISRSMDEEEKPGYKIKEYLAVNSGNIFKVLSCIAILFLVMALMPDSIAFKPPTSACVGVFLVSVAVAVYARRLGKERMEAEKEA